MTKNNPNVVVYGTPNCPYCHQVRDYLTEKKIDFEYIDVVQDQKKAEEVVKKSGQMGVPVVIIEIDKQEHVIIGFDKEKINEILELK